VRAEEEIRPKFYELKCGCVCVCLGVRACLLARLQLPWLRNRRESDIFRDIKALVKKRTGLAISYSHLFSPFLLVRKAPSWATIQKFSPMYQPPPSRSFLDSLHQKRPRTRKVTACWKNHLPSLHSFAQNPPAVSVFRFHLPDPLPNPALQLSWRVHSNG
jgi:hypothetical protein